MSFTITNAKCIAESKNKKSILVDAPDFDEPEWIAVSQIDEDSEVYKVGTSGDLIITEWLARYRGWI